MILKDFINHFQNCPFCLEPLLVAAKQKEETSNKHSFYINQDRNNLIIRVKSNFFVNPGRQSFEFTISADNGNIIHCDNTSQFVSLYNLDILLTKECSKCIRLGTQTAFFKQIHLFYNRTESKFAAEPIIEYFGFHENNHYYYFSNDFITKQSSLSVQLINAPMHMRPINTPFIPFEKFDFLNRDKLMAKINSIQLLC